MTSYCRQEVLRILQISSRQLQGWERAELIAPMESYSFQDLGQLRTLRNLREEDVPVAYIRHSIVAMKAVAGMSNPLVEASLVRTGTRLAFRHHGTFVDPIRRQFLFDFERVDSQRMSGGQELRRSTSFDLRQGVHDLFLDAVAAEEAGEKKRAMELYAEIISRDPNYAPAYINLGTIHFHLREYDRSEQLYRLATQAAPDYVLAFFDLGNVLDELDRPNESIAAYLKAVALAPKYPDVHYNLALAYERKAQSRDALRHWEAYVKLDSSGPWADHARGQIHKILGQEKLTIAWRKEAYHPRGKGMAALVLV